MRLRDLQGRGLVRWEDYTTEAIDLHAVDSTPLSNATFGSLSYPVDDEKTINELKKRFCGMDLPQCPRDCLPQ